ncbi:HAMP domain-containing sensor histidine kinase [Aquimarina sp. RZ0]|uniref:sensor histidine kinase n=1 Tax=Aquimarina sp. RZ0 TaxID=2607730 RepID=UPI0011F15766|nr:HAMP domain-containing sensor histidine kinase [Aquimarina sp. RZ0]KAA1248106.1 HAMP domain-containing histidine kinase [Aquimarina sp. RZ0]
MKNYFLIYALLLLVNTYCISQEATLDNILSRIEKLSDSVIFEKGKSKIRDLVAQKEYDTALLYANKFLEVSKHIRYNKGVGQMYNQLGIIHNSNNQLIKSLRNYKMAEIYYKRANYIKGLAIVNNSKANIEQQRGNLEKGANYLLKATIYYEEIKDSIGLSNIYNNLGNIYAGLKDIELGKKYYHKSILIKKKKKLKNISIMMNNLALLFIDNKKVDSAKTLLQESLEIGKKEESTQSIAQSYSILAKAALCEKEYTKAKKYYDSAMVASDKANWKSLIVNTKQQLGLIAIYTEEYQKANNFLTSARQEFAGLGLTPLLLKNYKFSAMLDSARGDFSSAYVWQKRYQELSDQTTSDATAQKIEKTEARYKAEMEQLKLIDEQEKREQQTIEELFRYRVLTYVSLGILFIILIFLILIIRTKRERKRYIKELNESNRVKNKLFSIISHDLKNEIHGLEGSLNLMKEDIISTDEFREIVPLLANKTQQTSILLNNLLNWSKSQMNELNAKPTNFDISEVICDKFTFFRAKAEQKDIKLINNLDTTMIFADKDMFAIVAQNLIANAIKFCNPGDTISLISKEKTESYEICFEDTGIGIHPDHIGKLFAEDTFTTDGTHHETGTGLGLRICKELIELNQGNIKVRSKPGEGSSFCISLPKAA